MKNSLSKRMLALLLFCSLLTSMVSMTVSGTDGATVEKTAGEKPLRLWYNEPAEDYNQTDYNNRWHSWQTQALPIGNGYMGGMIFGGLSSETVQFNEKTLWSGGPGNEGYNFGISDKNIENAYSNIESIRDQLANGALYLNPSVLSNGGSTGNGSGFGTYQNFGHLNFTFDNEIIRYENYQRWLDLRTATAGVSFVSGGVTYEREYFASYPDNVIAMRFSASSKNAVSFTLAMVSAQGGTTEASVAEDGTGILSVAGTVPDNGMKYESAVRVIADNGAVTVVDNKVHVQEADSVVILLTAGTDYKNEYPTYRGEDPHEAVIARIENAQKKGYESLRQTHLEDYQEIFSRVELDLGHDPEIDVPTDELLKAYHAGTYDKQALEVLFFQYGRYLIISSSREGSLPANLQGVWNEDNTAEWCCDYHFNINVQMNYWPAYVANMAETAIPYVEYIDSLRQSGRVSAEVFFNIVSDDTNPENGWMVSNMNNPFGYTAINWSGAWGWNPAGNAWVSDSLWEYYEFTQDKQYLQETIYPIIREAAVFWTQALVEHGERLVSSPSYSPENGQLTAGTTYDQSLIWQLYTDVIEASTLLDVDEELRALLIEQRSKLDPLHVSQRGTLKEWYDEDAEGFFTSDLQHRHISHLVGLYPGKLITADLPEYFEASKATLNERGDSGTGWACAHKMELWARLQEGNRAYDLLQSQLTRITSIATSYSQGGVYDNLFNACPPFQIDGNSGATAGMAEMLLQSHTGAISPLAALPAEWSDGAYKGLVARGNFETDAVWSNGGLTKFTVRSGSGNDCTISYPGIGDAEVTCNGKSVDVTVTENGNQISFATVKGAEYQITEIPTAPTGGTAVRKGLDEVLVSWNAVAGAESYHVYRSTDSENFALVAANVPSTTYTDLSAVHGQGIVYQYRVAAVSASGIEWKSSEAFFTQWDESVRVNSIDISSTTGVTTLRGATEEIQLTAAITPADTAIADLEWTITDTAGNATALAVVTQNGLVRASGLPAQKQTLIVTASAMDGSGVSDQFEILVDVDDVVQTAPNNLLSGLQMTLTQGKAQGYWGDVNLGDVKWLTDGFCGNEKNQNSLNRFSVAGGSANPIILDVELPDESPVALVNLFERLDDANNDPNNGTRRISNIEVQASYDGGSTYESIGTIVESESVWKNRYVRLWSFETETKESTKYLRFVITGKNVAMIIWEIEAYDIVESNLFLGENITLNPGSLWSQTSYGTNYLTDGYIGGPDEDGRSGDRLATSNTPTLGLVVQTDKAPELTTVVVSERIDVVEGYGTRIKSASLQYSTDGQNWQDAVIGSVVHQDTTNDIAIWVMNGIDLPEDARYVRALMQDTGSGAITLWEFMGYDQKSEPGRSALLNALQKTAGYEEADFDASGWSAFQTARAEAIAAANDIDADDVIMKAKADALLLTMNDIAAVYENGNEVGRHVDLEQAIAACGAGQHIRLLSSMIDCNITVSKDLCIDLAGNSLGNITVVEGVKLTLIDTATDDYEGMYGSATVIGSVETFAEVDGKTYLVVGESNIYSSHCYDLALTHISLNPSKDALGYKAQLFGDEIVQSRVQSFGFNMWVDGGKVKTFGKTGIDVVTLRLQNILAAGGGEININATAFVTLAVEGESYTKTSSQQTTTMKETLQAVDSAWNTYSEAQKNAVLALCKQYQDITSEWELDNIFGIINIPIT